MRRFGKPSTGVRSMRRIPVPLTAAESSALNWLQRYAREEQLPRKFWPLRKMALHIIIKNLRGDDFAELVKLNAATNSTPTP
jgi:hypothetical protein